MSMGGGKMKPEDLFASLRQIKDEEGKRRERENNPMLSLFQFMAARSTDPELARQFLEN